MTTRPGTIYILRNPYFRNAVVKIGRTKRVPEKRAREISRATGIPANFEVLYEEAVPDSDLAEMLIHRALSNFRINQRREFFQLPLKDAVRTVFKVCMALEQFETGEARPRLLIHVGDSRRTSNFVDNLKKVLSAHQGDQASVYLEYRGRQATARMQLGPDWRINVTSDLARALNKLRGASWELLTAPTGTDEAQEWATAPPEADEDDDSEIPF